MFLCNNISTGLAISVPHRSDHVPIIGIKKVKMTVEILPNATELFPEALTCHSLLLLPNYRRHPTKETLKSRLLEAIYHTRGFWKE